MTPNDRKRVRACVKAILQPDALDYPTGTANACLAVIDILNAEVERAALAARDNGCSWSIVGAMLGISKQAAQQRFG